MAHRVFIAFLIVIAAMAVMAVGLKGMSYYLTPLPLRPFHADYREMKPSGSISHGLGVVGAAMIVVGVTMYSTRKRVRVFWNLGRLSTWLEFHIFLCLLGPVLVMYHTTFKAGGIAAISLWTMLSVVTSGIVGRFLYVLIPRNLKGTELTSSQINEEFDRLGVLLLQTELGVQLLRHIDASFASVKRPETFVQTLSAFLRLQALKREVRRSVRTMITSSALPQRTAHTLYSLASARASLIQRSIILLQVEKLFYYWHAIHVPFTAIMFITLAMHIGVAVWMGYHWKF